MSCSFVFKFSFAKTTPNNNYHRKYKQLYKRKSLLAALVKFSFFTQWFVDKTEKYTDSRTENIIECFKMLSNGILTVCISSFLFFSKRASIPTHFRASLPFFQFFHNSFSLLLLVIHSLVFFFLSPSLIHYAHFQHSGKTARNLYMYFKGSSWKCHCIGVHYYMCSRAYYSDVDWISNTTNAAICGWNTFHTLFGNEVFLRAFETLCYACVSADVRCIHTHYLLLLYHVVHVSMLCIHYS